MKQNDEVQLSPDVLSSDSLSPAPAPLKELERMLRLHPEADVVHPDAA